MFLAQLELIISGKEPMIHLDVDKILEDVKNNCCEIKNINGNIYSNYPIKIKLVPV